MPCRVVVPTEDCGTSIVEVRARAPQPQAAAELANAVANAYIECRSEDWARATGRRQQMFTSQLDQVEQKLSVLQEELRALHPEDEIGRQMRSDEVEVLRRVRQQYLERRALEELRTLESTATAPSARLLEPAEVPLKAGRRPLW